MCENLVEVLSREMVKPSSPTPHHLRNLKLSFLDQIAPPVYIPLIFFYQSEPGHDTDRAQKSQSLKQSLSETLARFYPLAGRIKSNTLIDCNDAGVEFIEAQVHTQLSHIIENPNMEELKQYLPIEPYGIGTSTARDIVLAIQTTFFPCGGIAIGVCVSHSIADGSSLVTFMNTWATISCGGSNILNPNFDLACHFPPRDLVGFKPTSGITEEKLVTRRFVFDKKKLDTLKEATSLGVGSHVKDPTRVEAVSAFFWRKFKEMADLKSNNETTYVAVHAVNLRTRMSPPLPDHAFGNIWRMAIAISPSSDEKGCGDLVNKLRSAIKKIDSDFVKTLQDGYGYLEFLKRANQNLSSRGIVLCNFSSWCRFPVYEVDYGWGRPVWVCTTAMPFKNVVILMSTSCGEGIEAWVNMVEEDMDVLERSDDS